MTDTQIRPPDPDKNLARRMKSYVEGLQSRICTALEQLDAHGTFRADRWNREGGGGGLSAVLEGGRVFEKAGINTATVYGVLPDRMTSVLGVDAQPFYACGISLVIHPENPFVPTVHANFRYFAMGENIDDPADQWFGGGADLTPFYPFLEDARHFHSVWKSVCDRHEVADYGDFKAQCDRYFYLPHRGEARGIGGIFFDYWRAEPEQTYAFIADAGEVFLEAYLPIVERRMHVKYGDAERTYQEIRRGRYVEFNLLFDRGTRFGIETEGRTESIMMSLPPRVQWRYDWRAPDSSLEARAMWFFQPRDWLSLTDSDPPPLAEWSSGQRHPKKR